MSYRVFAMMVDQKTKDETYTFVGEYFSEQNARHAANENTHLMSAFVKVYGFIIKAELGKALTIEDAERIAKSYMNA